MSRLAYIVAGAILLLGAVPILHLSAQTAGPDTEVLEHGKELFETLAGGIGCAACHGMDGRGGDIAPPNIGASETDIRNAIGGVAVMNSIKLSRSDLRALVAYLRYLDEKPAGPDAEVLLAEGKKIFEETAGGVGCAACHGMDGRSGEIGPPNAGADEATVLAALKSVPVMAAVIRLTHSEVKAVVAYLKFLGERPPAQVADASGAAAAEPTPETDALLAQGKTIFDKTAGGIGCASCHGFDGRSGTIGPPNAGADETTVRNALQTVPEMQIVDLSHSEIKAVVAYLKYLGDHPN